jgi:hypothetical protein
VFVEAAGGRVPGPYMAVGGSYGGYLARRLAAAEHDVGAAARDADDVGLDRVEEATQA